MTQLLLLTQLPPMTQSSPLTQQPLSNDRRRQRSPGPASTINPAIGLPSNSDPLRHYRNVHGATNNIDSANDTTNPSSSNSSTNSRSLPVTTVYTPAQSRLNPQANILVPSTPSTDVPGHEFRFRPFIGASSLPIAVTASHTNQQRRSSMAAASNGHGGSNRGRTRGRGGRGASLAPGRLFSAPPAAASSSRGTSATIGPLIASCLTADHKKIQVEVFVYPASKITHVIKVVKALLPTGQYLHWNKSRNRFKEFATDKGLYYAMQDVDVTTSVDSIRTTVMSQMESIGYVFIESLAMKTKAAGDYEPHLKLLSSVHNTSVSTLTRLEEYRGDRVGFNISDMLSLPVSFPPKALIVDGVFRIFFAINSLETGRMINSEFHTCLMPLYQNKFFHDDPRVDLNEVGCPSLPEPNWCSACPPEQEGADWADNDSIISTEIVESESESRLGSLQPTVPSQRLPLQFSRPAQGLPLQSSGPSQGLPLQSSGPSQGLPLPIPPLSYNPNSGSGVQERERGFGQALIPPAIWRPNQPWERTCPDLNSAEAPLNWHIIGMRERAKAEMRDSSIPLPHIDAANYTEAATQFVGVLRRMAVTRDFTNVLSILDACNINNSTGTEFSISFGNGVGQEVLYKSGQWFVSNGEAWLLSRHDGFHTLNISPEGLSTEERCILIRILAALCGLLVVCGMPPEKFTPLIFQVLLNQGDVRSLTPGIFSEYHPGVVRLIQGWLDLGPNGALLGLDATNSTLAERNRATELRDHIITYFNIDVHMLATRDQATHQAMGVNLLLMAVFGTLDLGNQEWMAFADTFQLPCKNGFNLSDLFQKYEQGSQDILSIIWASRISDPDLFLSNLNILPKDSEERDDLEEKLSDRVPGLTTEGLIQGFFLRNGVPSLNKLIDQVPILPTGVELTRRNLEDPCFRARMFACAASGVPFVNVAEEMTVEFILAPSDRSYAGEIGDQGRRSMMKHGVVAWHTCACEASLPMPFILELADQDYPDADFDTFYDTFDQWLLAEILDGMAGYAGLT
ncbi:hypothetical protein BDN72DRAFT_863987 [Pluteus cervinus]|uniref:Uncharacterized protein n=1 Tax=Pluteus cervinus TaxID=181527 RepID=A0ACD3A6C0_9AGAR|nr:hypothetical protein BDN72DRAFT_863987 [Pluteus cervinus]